MLGKSLVSISSKQKQFLANKLCRVSCDLQLWVWFVKKNYAQNTVVVDNKHTDRWTDVIYIHEVIPVALTSLHRFPMQQQSCNPVMNPCCSGMHFSGHSECGSSKHCFVDVTLPVSASTINTAWQVLRTTGVFGSSEHTSYWVIQSPFLQVW